MLRINLLTPMVSPNSIGCFVPIANNRNLLKEIGLDITIYTSEEDSLYDADQIWIDSRVFRYVRREIRRGQREFSDITNFLIKCKKNADKLLWFDTTDGSGAPQFDIINYVDGYLKSSLLKNKSIYSTIRPSRPIYLDILEEKEGIIDENCGPQTGVLSPSDHSKVEVFWNSSFGHYGFLKRMNRFVQKNLRPPIYYWFGAKRSSENRRFDITCRLGVGHIFKTIVHHRLSALNLVKDHFQVNTDRVGHLKYLYEMRNSKIGISPFGAGEICYRDYEIFLNGCMLVKPDMGHMNTWPNLYIPNKTYVPTKWDHSDLVPIIEQYLKEDKFIHIASEGQKTYLHYLASYAGAKEFCERVKTVANMF